MDPYFSPQDSPWTELGDGIRRKIVGHTPQLMSVLVHFDRGAVGTPHAHEVHDQIAYCLAGSFDAEVGGVKKRIGVGDALVVPRGTLHGVVALEADSVLLDHFSPPRDDYL
jgi:quercetin dioxygenase-like cupin family protein